MEEAEAGNHHTPLGAVENVLHARANGPFRFGVAGPIHVGRVGEQQQDAAFP